MAKPRKEICHTYFVGYYGFGNAGDEHLLRQSQSLVNAGVAHVLPARRLLGLLDVVRRVPFMDAVVFGGGSLFQDRSSRMSLAYYLLILTWACLWRRRILVLGHGLGPIRSQGLRRWLACLLPHVGQVIARDTQSRGDFLALGSRESRTHLGVDLAYTAGSQSDLWAASGAVAVSVNGVIPDFLRDIATVTDDKGPCWIRMHAGHDETMSPAVHMTEKLAFESESQEFSGCIAMRYHACVWASLRGLPFLAVGEDPKLQALARTFGQPVLSMAASNAEKRSEIQVFLAQLPMYRERILAQRPEVLALAGKMQRWVAVFVSY